MAEDADNDGDSKPVASIQRAMLVLDAFLSADATLTLAELAEQTALPKSTVARILSTLELDDYVVRTRSGEFHVGSKPLRLANSFQRAVQPDEIVIPVLRSLVDKTQESAAYVVPHKNFRISLYRVHSKHAIRDHGAPGDVTPLDRGAAGRIFQAFADTSIKFEHIRECLIAITSGEINPEMTGIASPVFNGARDCIGAVALTGPANRFSVDAIERWKPLVLDAAKTITIRLGGNGRLFEKAQVRGASGS